MNSRIAKVIITGDTTSSRRRSKYRSNDEVVRREHTAALEAERSDGNTEDHQKEFRRGDGF